MFNDAARCMCGCLPTTALARAGCCTLLLYRTTGMSKNAVKVALTPAMRHGQGDSHRLRSPVRIGIRHRRPACFQEMRRAILLVMGCFAGAGLVTVAGCWPGYCGRVLDNGWSEVVALVAAFLIAVVTTPAGISGAVLLLPFQVTVLGTPSPSVTRPTCCTTSSRHRGRCTATGGRGRPAGDWPWCLSPGRCPASSPDRSSGLSCSPARASSTWWSPPS
jgi:hypothetical protein